MIPAQDLADGMLSAGFFAGCPIEADISRHIPFDARGYHSDDVVARGPLGDAIAGFDGTVLSLPGSWRDAGSPLPAKFDFRDYRIHCGHEPEQIVKIENLCYASWDGRIVYSERVLNEMEYNASLPETERRRHGHRYLTSPEIAPGRRGRGA